MDLSYTALAKLLLPKIPFTCKTAVVHLLHLSPTSSKWDLRTKLTIELIRVLTLPDEPPSVSDVQAQSMAAPDVKGKIWISRTAADIPPEEDAQSLLFRIIDQLNENHAIYTKPSYVRVEAEWTGYRADAKANTPEPTLSEKEKYAKLMAEVTSPVTILYFHGGAMYLMDPATHRGTVVKLAKLTGGRVYSVRYRLAPQNPFPAAILDAFISYLNLLYPPENSFHEAVPASHIIIAGDSAGGNISFALLQFLLQLHKGSTSGVPTVKWHGKQVEIPLPAGVATFSPWMDVTRCLPSQYSNAKFDYIPPPSLATKKPKPCSIWPADPPRSEYYCDGLITAHALVSPMAASSWTGSPPLFIGCGEELLSDEDKVVAARAAKQGVTVVWEQYESMPHCFAMMVGNLPESKAFFNSWARFCSDAVSRPAELKTNGAWVSVKSCHRSDVNVEALSEFTDNEVTAKMVKAMQEKVESFQKEHKTSTLPVI